MSQLLSPNAEIRLIRLEEKGWFQESALEKLDSQLMAQQKEIGELARKIKFLENRLLALENDNERISGQSGDAALLEMPPHYHQEKL